MYETPNAQRRAEQYHRALGARDPRFDGVFFVGITTTGIYCRPVCPARVSDPERRRFFESAAEAERAGFRPCLRCRPELAPGRARCDAISRLAQAAAKQIAAGALNGRSVASLARELGVSERHFRRAVEHELGVSPLELARTHRLLLAKRLLTDTSLPVTRIAFASGFQSLRRFNSVFRERYRMPPSALRRSGRASGPSALLPAHDLVRLTLSYRSPFAWGDSLGQLQRDAFAEAEVFEGRRYGRTVSLNGHRGVVFAEEPSPSPIERQSRHGSGSERHLNVDVSPSLVPVLMPLLARLRTLFDLDAEPHVVDAHLIDGGLGWFVRRRFGLRIPGTLEGFEAVLRVALGASHDPGLPSDLLRRVSRELGEPIDTGIAALRRLPPSAERVADAGARFLTRLGVPVPRAEGVAEAARLIASGALRLQSGEDADATQCALAEVPGIGGALAPRIVMHALSWPDALPAADPVLQRAAGVTSEPAMAALAERWRPWRAYAALHLLQGHLLAGLAAP